MCRFRYLGRSRRFGGPPDVAATRLRHEQRCPQTSRGDDEADGEGRLVRLRRVVARPARREPGPLRVENHAGQPLEQGDAEEDGHVAEAERDPDPRGVVDLARVGIALGFCNVPIFLGVALLQWLTGVILDAKWTGLATGGARHYPPQAYQ